jgi:SAM-dependent methyltransferase
VEADLATVQPEAVVPHGPFDLAVCRLVLMYQADPAATLRRIATLLRPGGRIVAIDVLHDPHYPCFEPPLPAAQRIFRLFCALVDRKGGTVEVARQYAALCADAGLRLVQQRVWGGVADDPRDYVDLYRDILLSMRGSLVTQGLATEDDIVTLVQDMEAARDSVQLGITTLQIEMVAEVP